METTAFDLLIVPTLLVTFGGIVAGAALLFLMRAIRALLDRIRASQCRLSLRESTSPFAARKATLR